MQELQEALAIALWLCSCRRCFQTALRLCNRGKLLQLHRGFAQAGRFCTLQALNLPALHPAAAACTHRSPCSFTKPPLQPSPPHPLLQAPCAPRISTTSSAASPAPPAAPTRRKMTAATLPPRAPKAVFATPATCKAATAASRRLSAAACTTAAICNGVRSSTPASVAASAAFAKGTARCNASQRAAAQTKRAWCRTG